MATNISFSTYGFMNGILILSEENWRRFFKPFITDSVQSGLTTIAGANMTVYVSAGECRCGAVMGILDEMIALDVANGDSTYDRIDSVIVQYTYGEPSTLAVAIVQGTPSANPVPPTLTKVYDTLWQMEIAQILVPSGATSSSEFTITDKRVIYESIESIIDDDTESEERVWSSQKTHEEIVSLSTEIYDSLNTKADAIERTASGDIVTITDGADNIPVKELVVAIDPVQDLHGYDAPWPAGGGKNLLPLTLTDFKSKNSAGTWNGNVYTYDGFTLTVSTTADDYITQIVVNGSSTSSSTRNFPFASGLQYSQDVMLSGCPSGGSSSTYYIFIGSVGYDYGNGQKINANTTTGNVQISILAGQTANNLVFKPMVRLYSDTNATFAPYSNICPISGHSSAVVTRTGKNLLQNIRDASVKTNGITFTKNADGSVTLSGTASTTAYYNIDFVNSISSAVTDLVKFQGERLTLSMNATSNVQINMEYYKKDGTVGMIPNSATLTSNTLTIPDDAYRARTYLRVTSGTAITTPVTIYPMIRLASETDSTFEPYHGTSVTVDLNGTRYGGVLNVLTGTLTVDKGYISDFTDLTANGTSSTGAYRYRINISNCAVYTVEHAISNGLKYNAQFNSPVNCFYNSDGYLSIFLSATDVATAKSFLENNGIAICYPLKTPTTVTLDPATLSTLLGENNVWTDTGDILNLTYRTDTKKYIEQKVADTNRKTCEMMTIVTDKMIAPDNLIVGDLVIVNDDLYKVINSNIASGEAMVIGTNVIKITLAEYIQSLI